MIRVTLELLPGGVEEDVEHLGTIIISNDIMKSLQTHGMRGTYSYEVFKKRKGKVFAKGRVRDFPRLSYHPWNLVLRVLKQEADKHGGTI